MGRSKKASGQKPSITDLKTLIHDHSLFFDRLVDLIPARFYVPVPDGQERPWFYGLSKAAKASAKKETREKLKKARRARFDPDQSASTLDLLQKNIIDEKKTLAAEEAEIENLSSDGDREGDVGDQQQVVSEDRSVTYEELRQRLRHRIEELRGNRNTRNPNKAEDQRRVKRKNIERQSKKGGDAPHGKRKRDEESGKDKHDQKKNKKKANDADISYGKVKLGGVDEKGRKKVKLSKQQELEKARKLEEAKKDPERGKMIGEKHSWKAAMSRAVGEKVHDDPRVLQKSLKKEQKRHQKHAEKWKERVESQNNIREEKQKTRAENIRERIQQRKTRRIEKREKKLMRPGFEGRKEGAMGLFSKLNIGSLDIGDYLAISAIFSATDSVCTLQVLSQDETPFLYSLVFGEGVVNDATSVVLFNAIQKFDLNHLDAFILLQLVGNFFYLFATSTFLGAVAGLLSAYIIKKLYFGRHSTDREVSIMMLMAYLSYMIAELLHLSGILTVFFCGIVMSHYTWHNVTESSRITTKHAFATLSFISETFLFLYVGMDALDIEKWRFVSDSPAKSLELSSLLLCLVLVGRAAFVFPLSFLSNLPKKSPTEKINFRQQVIIWWAGLMRGAVSIALAYNQFTRAGHTQLKGNAIMITSTITVVLFSTVVFGLLTKPLIRLLLPPCPKNVSFTSSDPPSPKSFLFPLLKNGQGSEVEIGGVNIINPTGLRLLLTKSSKSVHHYWRKFDDAFMRPLFGGRGFVPFVPGSPTERDCPAETSDNTW